MNRPQVALQGDRAIWSDVRDPYVPVRLSLLAILLFSLGILNATAESNAKNVLVLFSFSDRHDFSAFDDLKSGMQAAIPYPVNYFVENLEGRRFDDQAYEKELVANLQNTYRRVNLDLLLTENDPALQFALRHRDQLFPGVPIVFYDVDEAWMVSQKVWSGVTGVTAPVDVRGTIDLALHIHPNTSTVAIIIGDSPYERYWLTRIHAELLRHNNVREVDFVGVPMNQLFERVAALPQQTVVLFQLGRQESTEPALGPVDLLSWMGQRIPTYCVTAWYCINHGGIGGDSYDGYRQISLIAGLAKRVLSGERPENIPVVHDPWHQIHLDWRELHLWHIPESALPPGSVVLYRQPTIWEKYRKYAYAAIFLIAAQALWIFGLFWQRARKRKAEASLRESEKRFRIMADSTPSLIWMCDQQGRVTYLNHRRIEFTGPEEGAGYGDTWTKYVHPEDLNTVLDAVSAALKTREPFSKQYRLRRFDGVYRWMFDVASPRVNEDGSFAGFIGSAIDVTDQKMAQEALEKVGGRLIEAQEQERARIARELHDDVCQRLAILSVELAQATQNETPASTKQRLEEIQQLCIEIGQDVQSLSHQLHSSKLAYLGITAATRSFCNEFSQQHQVIIDFKDESMPAYVPKDVSLCLFRITQEALHNAIKYSGVKHFTVRLSASEEEVRLVIQDAGAGFDVEKAQSNDGLGLVSMKERVQLVHGRFYVESKPGSGTTVVAIVPVASTVIASPSNAQAVSGV